MDFSKTDGGKGPRTIGKGHHQLEQAALPDGLLLSRNAAFPNLEVKHTLGVLLGPSIEAKGMVLAPLLPEAWEAG